MKEASTKNLVKINKKCNGKPPAQVERNFMLGTKISRTLQIAVALILGLGPVTGYSQTQIYHYSGPINGSVEVALSPDGFGEGAYMADFGRISETLYYDPVAQTLREVGSVTVNQPSQTINISGSWVDDLGGSGSATLAVGNNGSFSFDFLSGGSLLVPVSGSGIYDGQKFAGSWNIQIPMITDVIAASPTSLTFSQFPLMGAPPASGGIDAGGVSLESGTSDGTDYVAWDQDSLVATSVPETPSFILIALGLSAMAFLHRNLSVNS